MKKFIKVNNMPRDYIPAIYKVFKDSLDYFIKTANNNLALLGLVAADITPLSTDKANFNSVLTYYEAKKTISKAATQKKDIVRKSAEAKTRALVMSIQSKAGITNDIKAQLQITVSGSTPPPPEIPLPPVNLVANIAGTGAYSLTWDRAGSSPNTLFVIVAKIRDTADWITIFTTIKTKYKHTGNPAGAMICTIPKPSVTKFKTRQVMWLW